MSKVILTADQIKHIDTVEAEVRAAKTTLEIAIQFHSNQTCDLRDKKLAFWDDLIKVNGLDPEKTYQASHKDGYVCIVEKKEAKDE